MEETKVLTASGEENWQKNAGGQGEEEGFLLYVFSELPRTKWIYCLLRNIQIWDIKKNPGTT